MRLLSRRGGATAHIGRPKAVPPTGQYFWCDANGNGLVEAGESTVPAADAKPWQEAHAELVDARGGLWEPQGTEGLRFLPLRTINEHGVPLYDMADMVWEPRPAEFANVIRVEYDAETDCMYLGGLTQEHPALGTEAWGGVGREIIRYDDWSKPTRQVHSRRCFRMPP